MIATPFDIAFVDWNMPNMTGIEFVKEVRQLEKRNDTDPMSLVMVTSEKTMGKLQEALDEAGADQFISKPFTVDELKAKLKKSVDKAAVRRGAPPAQATIGSAGAAETRRGFLWFIIQLRLGQPHLDIRREAAVLATTTEAVSTFPTAIADAVRAAVKKTFGRDLRRSAHFARQSTRRRRLTGASAAIIAFVGEVPLVLYTRVDARDRPRPCEAVLRHGGSIRQR